MVNRRGMTLLEITVAALLLSALLTLTLQMLTTLGHQRRAFERRTRALELAANVMERFSAQPWRDISPAAAEALDLTPDAEGMLPAPRLQVEVHEQQEPPPAKRITVTLFWESHSGQAPSSVRLSAWVHRKGAATQ